MDHNLLVATMPTANFIGGQLSGEGVRRDCKRLSDLEGVFEDTAGFRQMDGNQVVYEVDSFLPVEGGTEGGLFFGLTHLYPGTVGEEYFMTRGHFHAVENRAEYYWGIEGEGVLLLMDKDRNTRVEQMRPGSLHYIPGFTAHRVVNTGSVILRFGACWPSDAGHNYEAIAREGFSARIKRGTDQPVVIDEQV